MKLHKMTHELYFVLAGMPVAQSQDGSSADKEAGKKGPQAIASKDKHSKTPAKESKSKAPPQVLPLWSLKVYGPVSTLMELVEQSGNDSIITAV